MEKPTDQDVFQAPIEMTAPDVCFKTNLVNLMMIVVQLVFEPVVVAFVGLLAEDQTEIATVYQDREVEPPETIAARLNFLIGIVRDVNLEKSEDEPKLC